MEDILLVNICLITIIIFLCIVNISLCIVNEITAKKQYSEIMHRLDLLEEQFYPTEDEIKNVKKD